MAYIFDLSDAWAASGTTFTAIKMNVVDTASAAGSLLMDLQVGGVSQFKVSKTGALTVGNPSGFYSTALLDFTIGSGAAYLALQGAAFMRPNGGDATQFSVGIGMAASMSVGMDVKLVRDAANTLAQRNGVNAQAFNLYGTYTDGSNYRRVKTTMSTAGVAEIKPEGAGTGVSGNVLHISGLPTSNPGPGILWNNAGTPAIGT